MKKFLLGLLVLIVGAALGGLVVYNVVDRTPAVEAPAKELAAPKQQYQCPMHPTVIMDHPGNCPICGMKLVPMNAAAEPSSQPAQTNAPHGLATVDIDPARQQLIGLRTATVSRGSVAGSWRTVGRVAVDETRVRHLNVKVGGFIEELYVDFVGKPVKKGDPLFSMYAPELYSAQQELLLAIKTRDALAKSKALAQNGEELVQAARRKLALWDVSESEIQRMIETGRPSKSLTFYSPASGAVTRKDLVEGMRLEPGAMPLEITDLSSVWVLADVYESELRYLNVGMPAELTLKAFPNRTFTGKVAFIDPVLDPNTRTVTVRLNFENPTGDLRPEMFGEIILKGAGSEGLRIPADAVIDSGTQRVVFVDLGNGKFEPREVQLGAGDRELVQVVSGLEEGERVVTRANFLIDSESRFRASLAAMGAAKQTDGGAPAPATGHEGHGR